MQVPVRSGPSRRPVIYQLMVRTFGNTIETNEPGGTIEVNGCGRFSDINATALTALRDLGITHLWLTGVLEHASGTAYPGRPADDPDILKGIAGSPYAVKDCFDVCPDFADDPARRLEEFQTLVARCHDHGFKVLVDFVPNHVARSYGSDVRPASNFGAGDRVDVFFDRDNHYFYLRPEHPGGGPPLRLPTAGSPGCDGRFEPEDHIGRVTGNNALTWAPSTHDWYETVKLNYGHDFTTGPDTSHLPGREAELDEVPRTWRVMDEVLAHWQEIGVDGFRADMAHLVPAEFWAWALRRCRVRDPQVFFMAEAYDNDPAKLGHGHVLDRLLDSGFDAVYDDPAYDVLEGLYESGHWANDLDPLTFTGSRFHRSLRYVENHDEVRLAHPGSWGGHGMKVGKPASAVLFALGRGPLMMYQGQEVGETGDTPRGFGGGGGRSSIFDYGSMGSLARWVNGGSFDGGRLDSAQRELRAWYRDLLRVVAGPAFTDGEFYGLNHANKDNPDFGRIGDETVSGHWLHAFLRRDSRSGQAFLVVANFQPHETLFGVRVRIPADACMFLGHHTDEVWCLTDRLATDWSIEVARAMLESEGVPLPDLPPCSAMFLQIHDARR